MRVTKVTVDNIDPKRFGTCGEFSIILDNLLCIHRIRVVNGREGLVVTFPNTGNSKESPDGRRYFDIVHPTNNELRKSIQDDVLARYNEEVSKLRGVDEGLTFSGDK